MSLPGRPGQQSVTISSFVGGKSKPERFPEWYFPFLFPSHGDRVGQRVHICSYYNIIQTESSHRSFSVSCWLVICCLLSSQAAWNQRSDHSILAQHGPLPCVLPTATQKTDSRRRTLLITFQHHRVAISFCFVCSHLDPFTFGICLIYGSPSWVLVKYQRWQWLINKGKQLQVMHKRERTS